MKWEDVCRSPYKTKEERQTADAKVMELLNERGRIYEYRAKEISERRYAEMLERQSAERKALEEELERTRPQRARDLAYREYLHKFPPGNPEDAN